MISASRRHAKTGGTAQAPLMDSIAAVRMATLVSIANVSIVVDMYIFKYMLTNTMFLLKSV
jgi:hypothetical protein